VRGNSAEVVALQREHSKCEIVGMFYKIADGPSLEKYSQRDKKSASDARGEMALKVVLNKQ
jgi:hypothetical protein